MSIELSHVGELLVTRMLTALAQRGELDRVVCASTGVSLAADLGEAPSEFIADRARLRVSGGGELYACDGAQTVDVLAAAGDTAVALELKLGVTRMTYSAFRSRFCAPCGISGHKDLRLKGSMVAVLDRLLPFEAEHILVVDGARTWHLSKHWWLVVREQVWRSWAGRPPVESARFLILDHLARQFGGQVEFDRLVAEIVADNHATRWQIDFEGGRSAG